MASYEFEQDGKQYKITSVRYRAGMPPICECQFFYKGEWHLVRNYQMRIDFARRMERGALKFLESV